MRYHWLLLDADGTLFDYDRAEARALEQAFAQVGHGFAPAYLEVYRQINERLWQEFEQGRVAQEQLRVNRFAQLFAAIGAALDPEDFGQRYLRLLAQAAELMEGAEAMVRELYGRVGMVILTNGIAAVQRERLAHSAIREYILDIVVSQEVGAAKPDGRIFAAAWARMGQPPKESVLMVGDSPGSDIRGGQAYGIDTCWYNPAGRPQDPRFAARYEIRRLEELLPIVIAPERPGESASDLAPGAG